mgnify:CR=1 FL=1
MSYFKPWKNNISPGDRVNFDLLVDIEIRGTGLDGVLSFDSKIYLSTTATLDTSSAIEVSTLNNHDMSQFFETQYNH